MRKIILLLLGLTTLLMFSFKLVATYEVNSSTAEVNQIQGLYIFVDSKPVKEFEYLGTVKNSMSLSGSGQYQSVRDKLIKKLRKEYPEANGAIFNFHDGGTDMCDAIRIK